MRFHNINIRNILSEALNYGGIIVDVRTSEEFAKSHIPMAINLPLEENTGRQYFSSERKSDIGLLRKRGRQHTGCKNIDRERV